MTRLLVVGLGLLLLLVPAFTAAQSEGIVEGQVVNGTAGAQAIGADLPVKLSILQGDVETTSLETRTDASGRFRFEGLDTATSLTYWPEVTYFGVAYSTDEPVQFEGDTANLDATLNVYETTDDDGALRLNSVHLIAESFGEVLRVSEIHLLGNSADRTYVAASGQGDGVFVPLPDQAVGLAFQQDAQTDRFVEVDGGIVDTAPVPPGSESSLVFFSYHLMVRGDTVPLERTFAYPVDSLSVLVAQPGLTLRGGQLQAMGPELFQGRQYDFYVANDLAPGTPLDLELLPVAVAADPGSARAAGGVEAATAPAGSQGSQEQLRWLGFALTGLVVIGAVVYPLVRRSASAPSKNFDPTADPEARRLLAELADLEDEMEAGEMDETTYRRLRSEKQEAIRSLWQ